MIKVESLHLIAIIFIITKAWDQYLLYIEGLMIITIIIVL